MRGSQRPFRVANTAGLCPVPAVPRSGTRAPRGSLLSERRLGVSLPGRKAAAGVLPPVGPSLRPGPALAPRHLLLSAAGSSASRCGASVSPLLSCPVPALGKAVWPWANSSPPPPPDFDCRELRMVFRVLNCDGCMQSNSGVHKRSFMGTQPCSLFV